MALLINGEPISLADSKAQRAEDEDSFEVRGEESAEYRLTEKDQTDPAGRYRLLVSGDALRFQRASRAEWAEAKTYLQIEDEGISSIVFHEDGLVELLETLELHVETGGAVGLHVRRLLEMALVA